MQLRIRIRGYPIPLTPSKYARRVNGVVEGVVVVLIVERSA